MNRLLGVFTLITACCVAPPAAADTGFLDRAVIINGETYRYQVYVPLEWTKTEKWPVVAFLHENGRQGTDGSSHLAVGTGMELANVIRANRGLWRTIVVFPQAVPETTWVFGRMQDMALRQIDSAVTEFNGDPDRLYPWGNSVGAAGVLRMAARWPDKFAAIVASAGYTETPVNLAPERAAEDRRTNTFVTAADPFTALATTIRGIPLRLFHGDSDTVVSVEQSRKLAAAIRQTGSSSFAYTEYPGASHSQACVNAAKDAQTITWLLTQKRTPRY